MQHRAIHPGLLTIFAISLSWSLPSAALAEEPEGPTARPVGLLQVWGTLYDQDTNPQADPPGYGDPEDDMGFKVRRARVGLEGEVGRNIGYEVVFGAASPYDAWDPTPRQIGLVDAKLSYGARGFRVAAGQQKVPFSREALVSISEVVFGERSVATEHMAPGREVGLVAGYRASGFLVRAGAFNGNANFQGDDNTGMLWAGRAEWSQGKGENVYSTFGRVEKPVVGFAANAFYNQDLGVSTFAWGGDLILRVDGFALLVEGNLATISPTNADIVSPDVLVETSRMGVTGQAGYSYRGFEPAVRMSLYDDNRSAEDNGDVLEMLGGVTWHLARDRARFGLAYVYRGELGGRELLNDTLRLTGQLTW
jgi:hypothetical protein